MVKDFVIIADLGAAGNLVRNLMLLGETDWPMASDRLLTILNQYPVNLALKDWLQTEYQLRFWKRYYALDLSDNLDYIQFQQLPVTKLPRVWLNHSAFWQLGQYNMFAKDCKIVYVAPATPVGLEWQIRSYVNKKTIPLLHDFCFEHDREQQRRQYIDLHGEEAYYMLNITNMMHIINKRQQQFRQQIPDSQCIDLETLVTGSIPSVYHALKQATGLDIAIDSIKKVVTAWRNLHWNDTADWKYHKIFQQ